MVRKPWAEMNAEERAAFLAELEAAVAETNGAIRKWWLGNNADWLEKYAADAWGIIEAVPR